MPVIHDIEAMAGSQDAGFITAPLDHDDQARTTSSVPPSCAWL
jgi:hypothetical protein